MLMKKGMKREGEGEIGKKEKRGKERKRKRERKKGRKIKKRVR